MTLQEERDDVVQYIRTQLMGPVGGRGEIINERPDRRYIVGILHQRRLSLTAGTNDAELDDAGGAVGENGEVADDPVRLANQQMPSSVGLSVFVRAPGIEVAVAAAAYTRDSDGSWVRIELGNGGDTRGGRPVDVVVLRLPDARDTSSHPVLGGRGTLRVLSRPVGDGRLVTLTLMNAADAADDWPDAGEALCQAHVEVAAPDGEIVEYPDVRTVSIDPEEQELTLLYRRHRTFAIGHGCAASWDADDDRASAVWTDFIPATETPQLVPLEEEDRQVLRLRHLVEGSREDVAAGLDRFIDGYDSWVQDLPDENRDVPDSLQPARDRLTGRLADTLSRLRAGVEMLRSGPDVAFDAFRLANEAMLTSMWRGRDQGAGAHHDLGDAVHDSVPDSFSPVWRPFQLAFQLLVLPSLVEDDHGDRELVDLLWFPTGGGKTEAYLGLAAFVIFLGRLRDPLLDRGTQIITRYTLRLLTTQQFERTATMVCAVESIRRDDPNLLGEIPVTLGLWVGGASTPLHRHEAEEALTKLMSDPERLSPFGIERCPWCGTGLIPHNPTDERGLYGFVSEPGRFYVRCRDTACRFSNIIPAQVIDEELYASPPTMLVGTVDKFARLAWVAEAGVLLGAGRRPPDMVIQDELHLLSGPLGTMVGLYEAALGAVMEAFGTRPKIVASTATIRRADEQTKGLFARSARLFPPSGLIADNSYFMTRDDTSPGRLYLGVMSQSETPTFSLVHTAAACAEVTEHLGERLSDTLRDSYRTIVAYHNSLRELGKTMTLAADDIPARIGVITADEAKARHLGTVEELTSNLSSGDLASVLGRLGKAPENGGIDFVACTNMLSVGVDVPRLGLMIVHGQPKTTAEYIQATSRVGRQVEIAPGLVIAHYSANKPRDRSHYEQFRTYHQSLYRHVEPTSVTPFALPSRNRGLHAALVIIVRHAVGLNSNEEASGFSGALPGLDGLLDSLIEAVQTADPNEQAATRRHLGDRMEEWIDAAGSGSIRYSSSNQVTPSLLKDFGTPGPGWETLHSMRNVDRTCTIRIKDIKTR